MVASLRLLATVVGFAALVGAACGGDGDSSPSAGSNDASASPTLAMPASRYALNLDDLPKGYLTDRNATFTLNAKSYGGTGTFDSPQSGEQLLGQWGYLGGYETGFEPELRTTAVLNGGYYAEVEVHLFKDADSAGKAFTYFEGRLQGKSDRVNAALVGNQSSAWKLTAGKIEGSSIDAAYHRVIFRRGNLVAVVKTYGSDALMKTETARQLAAVVDEKALGTRPAVEPTALAPSATATAPK